MVKVFRPKYSFVRSKSVGMMALYVLHICNVMGYASDEYEQEQEQEQEQEEEGEQDGDDEYGPRFVELQPRFMADGLMDYRQYIERQAQRAHMENLEHARQQRMLEAYAAQDHTQQVPGTIIIYDQALAASQHNQW